MLPQIHLSAKLARIRMETNKKTTFSIFKNVAAPSPPKQKEEKSREYEKAEVKVCSQSAYQAAQTTTTTTAWHIF